MNRNLEKDVLKRILQDLNLLKTGITITQVIMILVLIFQGILTMLLLQKQL